MAVAAGETALGVSQNPEKMQSVSYWGPSLGLVYADEAIPLSERFLVTQVMRYYMGRDYDIGGDDEMSALMMRREWTPDSLRAIAPQIYLGHRHSPPPCHVTLAYLANSNTPRDIVEAFAAHPGFYYRETDWYVEMMRDEIETNILSRLDGHPPPRSPASDAGPDDPESQFMAFLATWNGTQAVRDATWRAYGGTPPRHVATGILEKPCVLRIGDVDARIVECHGDRESTRWDGKSEYNGGIGAVALEFRDVEERDRFLMAVIPACRYCDQECWRYLALAPMDDSGKAYRILLESKGKPKGSPARVYAVDCAILSLSPWEDFNRWGYVPVPKREKDSRPRRSGAP